MLQQVEEGRSASGMVGFDPVMDRTNLFHRVGERSCKWSQDIPLVCDGYRECHGLLVCDGPTFSVGYAHVVPNSGQYKLQKQRLAYKLDRPGEREAIRVYGENSHRATEDSFFRERGVREVREIEVDTGGRHWSLKYDFEQNKIFVLVGSNTVVDEYPGFSDRVFDPNGRSTFELEKRKSVIMFEALQRVVYEQFSQYAAGIPLDAANELVGPMEAFVGDRVSFGELTEYITMKELGYVLNDTLIVPHVFREELYSFDIAALEISRDRDSHCDICTIDQEDQRRLYAALLSRCCDGVVVADADTALINWAGQEVLAKLSRERDVKLYVVDQSERKLSDGMLDVIAGIVQDHQLACSVDRGVLNNGEKIGGAAVIDTFLEVA